ncbi:MAG TPA: VOC family protein [Nitrospiraceae bacterium]|nr:VOC family protein [Nitrospiraceae bacterium]
MHRLVYLMSASALLITVTAASAEEVPQTEHHQADSASQERSCKAAIQGPGSLEGFESMQVETSDIERHEQFFESVLHAPVVQRIDHPQVDSLRGYCYRGVLIVVRQDLRTPRQTGWVQINFTVSDVAAVQAEVEGSYGASALSQLAEEERAKIVRFRLKPEVSRGHHKAIRFEVTGPEGFMIGFDQYK